MKYCADILINLDSIHFLGNLTNNLTDFSASDVLNNHKSVLTTVGIQTINEELDLPYIIEFRRCTKLPINTDSMQNY